MCRIDGCFNFCSSSLQPCQNYVQSPGEGHLELMNLGEVFLGACFPLFPIEIAVRFAVAASSQNYSVCSLVVPRLEEAILTPVLKKNFKRPSILGQEGHSYSQKHSNLSYDQFGGGLEQSDTAPPLLPPGWRDTDSFSWICSVFNSSISRRS